jgi:hypothetical protein
LRVGRSTGVSTLSSFVTASAVITAIFAMVFACLQSYWAAGGKKWLAGAWGGKYRQLPTRLRWGSGVSAAVFLLAAYLLPARDGIWETEIRFGVVMVSVWLFVALFFVSALANFASSSRWERMLNAPISLVMSGLSLVVALSTEPT